MLYLLVPGYLPTCGGRPFFRLAIFKIRYLIRKPVKLLNLVHSDLGDLKHTMTRGGKKFYVIFVDDHSRFTKLYLLRTKDEALEMFIKYKNEVESQKNKRIKRLRTNRGSEQNGIIHEVTPPYSPKSNRIDKRKNSTLKEKMNAMLVSSRLSSNMWGGSHSFSLLYTV